MTLRAGDAAPRRRIVHVVDTFAPRVGGIETQVADLADRQARAGHAVHVLTVTAGERSAPGRFRRTETRESGVKVHRLATPWTFGVPVHPAQGRLLGRALDLLTRDLPTGGLVVHAHAGVVSPFAWAGLRVAVRRGLPTVATWHCRLDGLEAPLGVLARAAGLAGPGAPFAATAVSPVAAAPVARALGRADVGLVPNGLDVAAWRVAAEQHRDAHAAAVGDRPLRIVATQRLARRKRAGVLVESVLRAHRVLGRDDGGSARIHLTLVGSGPEARPLRARARAAGAEDVVELQGRLSREELPALYAGADVFAAPAELEAFGIAALEARACGLPVITPRGSGPTGFVEHGSDGLVLPDGSAGSFARAWLELAAERGSDLRARLRRGAGRPPSAGWTVVLAACAEAYRRADARSSSAVAPVHSDE